MRDAEEEMDKRSWSSLARVEVSPHLDEEGMKTKGKARNVFAAPPPSPAADLCRLAVGSPKRPPRRSQGLSQLALRLPDCLLLHSAPGTLRQ